MKKSLQILFSIIIAIFAISACFTGCSKTPTTSTVLLVQKTKNVSFPDVKETSIYKQLQDDMMTNGSNAIVYELDGMAYNDSNKIVADIPNGISKANKTTKAKNFANAVIRACDSTVPKTPEVDYLYGITSAKNYLCDSGSDIKKLIIVGTGISTKGSIDFVKNSLYCDADNYISFLKEENLLPDMSSIVVDFYITQTSDEQQLLQNSDIEIIEDFYGELFAECGTKVTFHRMNAIVSNEDYTSYPNVSTVDIRVGEFQSELNNINITLEESTTFVSNSCEFVNEEKTKNSLSNIVDAINNSSSKTLIFGSTAYTSSSDNVHFQFAQKRAKTIYDELIGMGVNPNKLEYYSLGKSDENPYRTNDTGKFDTEKNHAANRVVYIVSADLEKGKTLKAVALNFDINK